MKKFFTLFICASMSMTMFAQRHIHENIISDVTFNEMVKMAPMKSSIFKEPAINLAAAYKGNGFTYSQTDKSWVAVNEWDVTPSVATYEGVDYDVIYDIFPPGIFNGAVDFEYYTDENKIIIPCIPYAKYDETYLVYPMDYADFYNGGSGDIVLEISDDGELSIPAENSEHVYGWFAATFDETTYLAQEVAGSFAQYAGLEYAKVGTVGISNVTYNKIMPIKVITDKGIIIRKGNEEYTTTGIRIK